MLSVRHLSEITPSPFGQRPGIPHLASGAPDLGRKTKEAESEVSARFRAYPSPPMSGSPPLPPKSAREANERDTARSIFPNALPQDVYRERSARQSPADHRQHLPPPIPMSRPRPQELSRDPYGFQRSYEEALPQTPSYSPQQRPGIPHGAYQQQYINSAGPSSEGAFLVTSRASGQENQPYTSPKSQRKTKGHVASACVPCKRAHLRCDAQRPCSRCLSNGKEDACVDVQHKKRGRPRLRDDRDARYDPMRLPQYPDVSLRRTLGVGGPGGPQDHEFDDRLQQPQLYRHPETSTSGAPIHRQFGSASDAYSYGAVSPTVVPVEPAAYLTMNLEFSKVSSAFLDAIGAKSVTGRALRDIVIANEAGKIFDIQNQLALEQKRREPNYLPPILGHGVPVIQGLGFSTGEVTKFPLNVHEKFSFIGSDGYTRQHFLRMGLGKEGSVYFVVLLLNLPHRYPPPPPPSQTAHSQIPSYQTPLSPQVSVGSRKPTPAHFDPIRHRLSESSLTFRPSLSLQDQANQLPLHADPATTSPASQYVNSAGESWRPGPSLQPSREPGRNESPLPANRTAPPNFQLPPIRAQSEHRPPPPTQGWQRDERRSRLDIGGLIEKPEGPGRPQ